METLLSVGLFFVIVTMVYIVIFTCFDIDCRMGDAVFTGIGIGGCLLMIIGLLIGIL